MATKLTAEEIRAIDEKMNNPNADVVCPRCGGKLIFKDYATASEVKCETSNCVRGVVRGV